jgi:hypothetical protein
MVQLTKHLSSKDLQSVTKQFGQNSEKAYVYNIIDPRTPVQCCVWKYLRKMFLANYPTLFRVGEGGIVFYAEQYLEMRRYVYILYHCPKTFCH